MAENTAEIKPEDFNDFEDYRKALIDSPQYSAEADSSFEKFRKFILNGGFPSPYVVEVSDKLFSIELRKKLYQSTENMIKNSSYFKLLSMYVKMSAVFFLDQQKDKRRRKIIIEFNNPPPDDLINFIQRIGVSVVYGDKIHEAFSEDKQKVTPEEMSSIMKNIGEHFANMMKLEFSKEGIKSAEKQIINEILTAQKNNEVFGFTTNNDFYMMNRTLELAAFSGLVVEKLGLTGLEYSWFPLDIFTSKIRGVPVIFVYNLSGIKSDIKAVRQVDLIHSADAFIRGRGSTLGFVETVIEEMPSNLKQDAVYQKLYEKDSEKTKYAFGEATDERINPGWRYKLKRLIFGKKKYFEYKPEYHGLRKV